MMISLKTLVHHEDKHDTYTTTVNTVQASRTQLHSSPSVCSQKGPVRSVLRPRESRHATGMQYEMYGKVIVPIMILTTIVSTVIRKSSERHSNTLQSQTKKQDTDIPAAQSSNYRRYAH